MTGFDWSRAKRRAAIGRQARREAAPYAKLTTEQARYIREASLPIKQLAREHGVCPKTVREIRRSVIWRWL